MKRFLLHQKGVFALLLALFLGMGTAYAYDFSEVYSGNTFYFHITDASNHYVKLTYPGTLNEPWGGHAQPTGNIILPSTISHGGTDYTVTAIGDYTFFRCSGMTGSLNIPNTVTSIGEFAFQVCSGLNGSLNLGNTVTEIGPYAFMDCGFTGSLTLPNTLTSIGEIAFAYCEGFTGSLNIPNSVTSIGEAAFAGCTGFNGTLTIGTGVTSMGASAFKNCSSFTHVNYNAVNCANVNSTAQPFENCTGTITIGNTVQRIPSYMFYQADGLTGSLTIPNSVTTVGSCAFADCNGFTGSLTIGNSVTTIEFGGFGWCPNFTGTLTLGSSLTTIGAQAFYIDYGFTGTLTIPNSVTTIGNYAFDLCSGFTGSLTIPNSVTNVGEGAFLDCSGFNGTLTIGTGVTSIGYEAFKNCTGFTHVKYNATNCNDVALNYNGTYESPLKNCNGMLTIGNTVQRIPSYMFYQCSGFTGSLAIPNSVTSVGYCAFAGCEGFTGSLTIGNSVTTIEFGGFGWCPNFTGTLTLGSSLTTIDDQAFYADEGFTGSLTIPNSVTTIGNTAFKNCFGFTGSLTIGTSVASIGSGAFQSCTGITQVNYNAINCADVTQTDKPFENCGGTLTIGDQVQRIPAHLFRQCEYITGPLTIPNSVTTIGTNAFINCFGLTSLTLGNSVTTIGSGAFGNCNNITGSLTIPSSVTTIGASAFQYLGLTGSLTIGYGVTSMGNYAFSGCSNLSSMMVYPETPPTLGSNAFQNVPKTIPVKVPCGKVSAYQNASGWNAFTNIQEYCDPLTYEINPDGVSVTVTGHVDGPNATGELFIPETKVIDGVAYTVTAIGNDAFSNCYGLTGSLIIPNTVTSIGDFAFSECSGLTGNLVIPNTVTSIGRYAFQVCTGFTGTLTLSNNLTTLDRGAFYLCSGFTGTLNLPNTLTEISKDAFAGCTGFTGTLTIPNTVTSIGELAFHSCSGFTGTLTIGTGVTSIGSSAFYDCNHFTHVNYNAVNCADINSLTAKPFENCTGTITIGNTVQRIPAYLFFEADGLTGSLTIPNSVTTIGSCAFAGCDGFTGSLTIGNSVTTIEFGGFGWCPNFTTLTLGSSLTTIGAQAFYVDTGFTGTLTIPNSVTYIGSHAFDYCYNFTGPLTIPNSVACIESMAFQDCYGFTGTLTIGTSLTELGSGAFYNCTGFTQVNYNAINCAVVPFSDGSYSSPFESCEGTLNIGSNVQRIPAYLFKDCTGFTGSLYIPSSVTEVGANAFDNCTGFTGSLILGNSLTTIGDFAFYGMHFTGSLTIPDSVTSLGEYAFAWCGYFTGSLTIGNSLTTIPVSAFYQCNNFTSLTMPSSVTTIEGYAFSRCNSLTSMTVHAETPPTLGVEAFELVSTNIPVYVPCGSISDYQAANGWSTFTNYQCIPWTVTLTANPWDGGTVSGEGTYANGASCTVSATPNDNYLFMHWRKNGEVVSSNASLSFNVYEDTQLEAVFMPTSNAGTIIGSGEDTELTLPSYSYYNYGLSQQIYTVSELNGSFTINSISFFNAGNEETRRYDVYLVHTSKSSFSSNTDWIPVYQADCVYTGLVTMRKGMWTTIVLDTPFNYNGTSNLALIMDDNTGDFTYSPHMACRVYNAPQSNQAMRIYSDGTNYAANNPSSYTGTLLSVKNQIMFNRPVYTITATPNNASMGTVSGAGQYGYGDLCRVKATANSGYTFLDWMDINGVAATDEAEYEFFVTGDRTLRANFFEGTDVCNLTFNLDNYDQGWGSNYLEVHFGNGMSHLFGVLNDEGFATYTLPFVNGNHVELNMQVGTFSDQYHFEVRYANGNMACTSDVLVGESSYEFDVDCDEKPAAWVYVGDGDDMTNNYLPSYSYYNYGLSQQIYTAAEIGSAGNITSIAFYNQGEDNTKTRTYDIYLKPTNKFEFFNGTDWVSVSEEDKVFSGEVTMTTNEWTFITFDKPFVYDGTTNLVLVMDDNSGNYTSAPHMECRVYQTGLDQAIRAYSDGTNYDPFAPTSYSGTIMDMKNQVYFGFASIDCWPPVALTATDITTNSATLNWEGFQDSYNMRYRVKPYFYEDFESGLDGWTVIQNGEGNSNTSWHSFNASGYGDFGNHSGDHVAASFSWYNGTVYNVDNWLITPQVTLNGILSFWVRGDASWPDKYYVCVSTTQPNINAFTVLGVERYPTGEWTEVTIDLSAYAGQQGYIAIHHQDEDNYYLFIDDFGIYSGEGMSEWVEHNNVTSPVTIAGLNSATNYVWQVQGISTSCDGGATDWSETATFTTILCSPEDQCELSFELTDSYGDGWNGAAIRVVDVETGIVLATMTNVTYDHANAPITENYTLAVCDGRELRFEWVSGSYDSECSYVVTDVNGDEIFSGSGAMSAPVTYMVNCGGEQTIALSAGWNWVSFNVETTLEDLEDALLEAYPDAANNALVVKSKSNGQTAYNTNAHRWIGGLENVGLDLSQMYMVKVPTANEITVEGTPVDPTDHPITIASGVNWIAFPLSESMSITDAFAGFPNNGDIVKAKGGGQATWNSGASRWIGALANTPLEPGQGYIYNSKATGNRTFTFPVGAK